ncbi:MAG: DciA family protein [Candidatus Dasytiphilus stammeri]
MRASYPCTLKNIFENSSEHSTLKYLHKKYKYLIYLDQLIKSVLPFHFHSCCRVIKFQKGILSLSISNATAMTRLRYQRSILLSILQSMIPSLIEINISINPSLQITNAIVLVNSSKLNNPIFHRTISHKSAELLRKVASKCPEKIKYTLKRLASLAQPN